MATPIKNATRLTSSLDGYYKVRGGSSHLHANYMRFVITSSTVNICTMVQEVLTACPYIIPQSSLTGAMPTWHC